MITTKEDYIRYLDICINKLNEYKERDDFSSVLLNMRQERPVTKDYNGQMIQSGPEVFELRITDMAKRGLPVK